MTEILKKLNRNIVVCGHFGSGKTNVAVAIALASGSRTALVDLDIVNPYFRAADAEPVLREAGVDCIIPRFANTNVDLPGIGGDVYSVFSNEERDPDYRGIFDVGGDNGAIALGRYTEHLKNFGCSLVYVLSMYRPLTCDHEDVLDDLHEIEECARLKADFLINNSNIGEETTLEALEASITFADEVSRLTGLPLLCTTAMSEEHCRNLSAKYPDHVFVNIPNTTRRLF